MTKNNIKTIFNLFIGCYFLSQFMGCTVIGFGLGAASDSGKTDYQCCTVKELSEKQKGSVIKVIKKNGEELQGKLIGLEKRDEKEYLEDYNQIKKRGINEDSLPALGETLILLISAGKEINCRLVGFDYDGIIVTEEGSNVYSKGRFQSLKEAEIIDGEGNKIEVPGLERMIETGKIPVLSVLKIQTASGEININPVEISVILMVNKKDGKIKGLVLGAIVDCALLIIINTNLNNSFSGGWNLNFE
jgi:hypothetical protein